MFTACSGIRESIIDTRTGEKIAGYSKDCIYQIGVNQRKDFSEQEWKTAEKDMLGFSFSNEYKPASPEDYLTGVGFSKHYSTAKGIKVGDTPEKARDIYGEPKAKIIDFGKDYDSRVHWVYYGLFYDGLTILTDSAYTTIFSVAVGHDTFFDLKANKKYLKK